MSARANRLGILILLLLTLSAAARVQAQAPSDLDQYVARAMKIFDVPGISVAIVKDGKVVVSKGTSVE